MRYREETRYDARYVFDPHQQCWTTTGPPLAQHEGILAALIGDRALDLGGTTNNEGRMPPDFGTRLLTADLLFSDHAVSAPKACLDPGSVTQSQRSKAP